MKINSASFESIENNKRIQPKGMPSKPTLSNKTGIKNYNKVAGAFLLLFRVSSRIKDADDKVWYVNKASLRDWGNSNSDDGKFKLKKLDTLLQNMKNHQRPPIKSTSESSPKPSYTAKEIDQKEQLVSKKTQVNATQDPAQKVKSLEKIGGYERGNNNTCFIATGLQALREVPVVRRNLDVKLVQGEEESKGLFDLRQKIQTSLSRFYSETDKGKAINKHEFRKFHQLLHKYHQMMEVTEDSLVGKGECYIPPEGREGDPMCVVHCTMIALGLASDYRLFGMDRGDLVPGDIVAELQDHNIGEHLQFLDPKELYILQRYKIYDKENYTPLTNEISLEINSAKGKYALVAATGGTDNHAVAYLKEAGNPENWIYCDDSSIKKVSSISSHHRMIYLFYAKID